MTVRRIRLSARARADVDEVLAYTLARFGERKRAEYLELIHLALDDIRANPDGAPAKHRPEIPSGARTFHIARRGRPARYFFLYRISNEIVEISRFIHDAMDLTRHLPDGFEPDSSD